MRKVVLTYGIIAGVIIAILMTISGTLFEFGSNFSMSLALGYASMIISLSMVFFGIRSYRDNYSGGSMTFGKGFLVGLYITIIASVLYVVSWKIYSSIAIPDFADKYASRVIEEAKKSGASVAEIATKTQEMTEWKQWYANPIVEFGMTFLEIFPVGLLISVICALILKRKPAGATQTS
ncbi:MAG TPA: DUF4199 domain-containing protein [Candidatus Kapabacteria bacterium]|nr:DUF4199 domain-containing protein [Candidatus Kapabacteria bacterium]